MSLKRFFQGSRVAAVALTATFAASVAMAQAAQKSINVTDVTGRQVSVKAPAQKAIIAWSGSGGPFMTMSALLGKDVHKHIAGWDQGLSMHRRDMYDAYLKTVPELAKLPVVGSPDSDDFNMEKVLALTPDVAIFPVGMKETIDAGVGKKLQDAGIPVLFIDYHAETVENHTKSTLLMGQVFGKEARAKQLADMYAAKRKDIAARVAKAKAAGRVAPKVYVEGGSKGAAGYGHTYGKGFMWGGITEIAGGINVSANAVGKSSGPIAPEFVLQANPDIVVITGSFWPKEPASLLMGYTANDQGVQKKLGEFAARPGWNGINAIKNKRLYTIHHGLGRDLSDFTAIAAMGKYCYPEEFKDVDPMGELRTYYKTFLPYELSGIWFSQWK
ncbi:MAG: ABC transporter substrate-binding protein [Brachymonas sp.]|nr:ABC transporter substrate-binding protein [Brachymonas sp.]MBP6966657.1 ABC transporter substrate-binding protein [Brachymonas sp.]MBP7246529.1 ABC transporter substrate-binding protein [Brachymonas sp.]MBP7724846.1 ABC transporter substrate-binding protein [Brachymonas sp.]MBP7734068.1 ABC transporter substrate-binding protein [Brachymonas sp.]